MLLVNDASGFHLIADCLESCGVVHGQVGEHLAVDLDACFVYEAHQLGVGKILHACGGVDTLNPESAEVALFLLAVAISVCKTFLPSILGYGPYVAARTIISAGEFEDFLTLFS